MSPNNSNRPMTLKVSIEHNPTLRAQIAAWKVRRYLSRNGGTK